MRNPDEFWMGCKTEAFRTVHERLPFSFIEKPSPALRSNDGEVFLFCTIKPGLYLWISTIKFETKMKLLQNMPQK